MLISTLQGEEGAADRQGATQGTGYAPRIEPLGEIVLNSDRENYTRLASRWRSYYVLSRLAQEPIEYQRALLLYTNGADAATVVGNSARYRIDESLELILDILRQYCVGERNVVHKRYRFNTRVQQPGESFDAFYSKLRALAERCSFDYVAGRDDKPLPADEMLRDRIVLGITDDAVRKKLISQGNSLTLTNAVRMCRSHEVKNTVMKSVAKSEAIDAVRKASVKPKRGSDSPKPVVSRHIRKGKHGEGNKCNHCGRGSHERKECPAREAECRVCKKKGHFAALCRSTTLLEVSGETRLDPFTGALYDINQLSVGAWRATVKVNGHATDFKLDTGADGTAVGDCERWLKDMQLEQLMLVYADQEGAT